MNRISAVAAISIGMGAALAPAAASAQTSDQWQFAAVIYGWLPDISGKTAFPGAVASNDIHVDVSTILDHLKFTFMGSFEARKDRFGMFTDVVYMDVGDSKSGTRDVTVGGLPLPASVTGDFNLDLKTVVWTLAGEYRVATDPSAHVDLLAGARLVDARQTLGWTFSADLGPINNPGRSGNKEVNVSNWDGIVGAKGSIVIPGSREWFAPWYVDVGTGQSDLTWQAIGGLGYRFSWGEAVAVWRYMDYKFKSGAPIEKLTFSGPAMGVAFRWQ
jgi:hypothetical protein